MASVVIKKEAKAERSSRKAFKMNEMSFFFMRIKKVQFLLIILHHDDVDDFLVREEKKKLKHETFLGVDDDGT